MSAAVDGVSMKGNGRGLRAEDGSAVAVRNAAATGNALNGFVALASSRPVDITISDSISSLNGAAGIYSGAFATVRIANTTITGNSIGLQVVGGSMISLGNNTLAGNGSNGAPTATIGRI